MSQLLTNFIFQFHTLANAQAAPAGGGAAPSLFEQVIPFLAFFAIFYFFIIRPQSKRHKDHASFLGQLKRGDSVITSGGIFGKVEGITDQFVTLEVSDGVQIRILKAQIASNVKDAANAKEGGANA